MPTVIFDQMLGVVFNSVKVYRDDIPEKLVSHYKRIHYLVPDEVLVFSSEDLTASFFHCQDCCELVEIKEIVGDLSDLEGVPLLESEVTTESSWNDEMYEHETYSFYKFRTQKGFVTITWVGCSNGYYSETVDVDFLYKVNSHNIPAKEDSHQRVSDSNYM